MKKALPKKHNYVSTLNVIFVHLGEGVIFYISRKNNMYLSRKGNTSINLGTERGTDGAYPSRAPAPTNVI